LARFVVRTIAIGAMAFPVLGCLTPAAEERIGAAEEARVQESVGLSDHAASAQWVDAVGRRVAAFAPPGVNYRFHVLDMEEPNAFALPGGPVYISRGLLAFLNSEDELAGVLGHEIGHIADRHAAGRQRVATPIAILLGLPAAIVGTIAPGLGRLATLPASMAGGAAMASYSRKQEHAADELGVGYAAAAGYDPAGLASALEALEREVALDGDLESEASFFANHPTTPDRIERVREHARIQVTRPRAPIAAGRDSVLARQVGLMVGPNPKHGTFVGDRYLHPELAFSIRFPSEWKHLNLPEAVVSLPDVERRDVFVTLRIAGEGDDPFDLFGEDGPDPAIRDRIDRREIAGLPAASLVLAAEGSVVDLTWLAHGGHIYMITGVSPPGRARSLAAVFLRVADSFAPLSASDLAAIRVERVAVTTAEPGESIAALVGRSGSTWDAKHVAAANGWSVAQHLEADRSVKIAVSQPYGGLVP